MLPKNGLTTMNAAGPDMRRRTKTLLTTLIVLTVTAILVVGFVLMWDVFLKDKLDKLINTDFYASEEPLLRSDTKVNLTTTGMAQLKDSERQLLCNYFTCYYASLGSFYHENMTRFYDFQCCDEIYDELALDFEINSAKSSSADYSFDECSVNIFLVNRRTSKDGTATLTVRVSSEISYPCSAYPLSVSDENHSFVLTTEDEPLISSHTTDRISRQYADILLAEIIARDGYVKEDLAYTYYYGYTETALKLLPEKYSVFAEALSEMLTSEKEPSFTAEYEYDRNAAAEYARSSEGHSGRFGSYDENDVNFCSICLSSVGIPMDSQGNRLTQWKWYDYEENNARVQSGCTKSWFDRKAFWTYAAENTGFGLVAEQTTCPKTGDIIQLTVPCEDSEAKAILQCMITGVVTGKNGVADYLICTDKIKNAPLSLLWNGDMRCISIIGYNTANI